MILEMDKQIMVNFWWQGGGECVRELIVIVMKMMEK
jgi:hypothetical protein